MGTTPEKGKIMGVYKELDITYQEIVDREADAMISGKPFSDAEKQIWDSIGTFDHNLADELTDEYPYETALVCIERGQIPVDNEAWQKLVVRLAYNAITDTEEFQACIAHSRFTVQDVQHMLDLAIGAVLQHPNFRITGFQQLPPKF